MKGTNRTNGPILVSLGRPTFHSPVEADGRLTVFCCLFSARERIVVVDLGRVCFCDESLLKHIDGVNHFPSTESRSSASDVTAAARTCVIPGL